MSNSNNNISKQYQQLPVQSGGQTVMGSFRGDGVVTRHGIVYIVDKLMVPCVEQVAQEIATYISSMQTVKPSFAVDSIPLLTDRCKTSTKHSVQRGPAPRTTTSPTTDGHHVDTASEHVQLTQQQSKGIKGATGGGGQAAGLGEHHQVTGGGAGGVVPIPPVDLAKGVPVVVKQPAVQPDMEPKIKHTAAQELSINYHDILNKIHEEEDAGYYLWMPMLGGLVQQGQHDQHPVRLSVDQLEIIRGKSRPIILAPPKHLLSCGPTGQLTVQSDKHEQYDVISPTVPLVLLDKFQVQPTQSHAHYRTGDAVPRSLKAQSQTHTHESTHIGAHDEGVGRDQESLLKPQDSEVNMGEVHDDHFDREQGSSKRINERLGAHAVTVESAQSRQQQNEPKQSGWDDDGSGWQSPGGASQHRSGSRSDATSAGSTKRSSTHAQTMDHPQATRQQPKKLSRKQMKKLAQPDAISPLLQDACVFRHLIRAQLPIAQADIGSKFIVRLVFADLGHSYATKLRINIDSCSQGTYCWKNSAWAWMESWATALTYEENAPVGEAEQNEDCPCRTISIEEGVFNKGQFFPAQENNVWMVTAESSWIRVAITAIDSENKPNIGLVAIESFSEDEWIKAMAKKNKHINLEYDQSLYTFNNKQYQYDDYAQPYDLDGGAALDDDFQDYSEREKLRNILKQMENEVEM